MTNSCSKKRASYITIAFFFILNGVEYAVIFPTLWLYISETYAAKPYHMGLVIAAFSLSGLLVGPLVGRWADKTRNIKLIVLFCTLWEIAGNMMYVMGVSVWFIVASRLVCGVGSAAGAAIMADVSRSTTDTERTGVLTRLMLCRQMGLLVGPSFNFFLRKFNFSLLGYKVDAYNAAGLFMIVLWSLHEVAVVFCFWNLELMAQAEDEAIEESHNHIQKRLSQASAGMRNGDSGAINSRSHTPTQYGSVGTENSRSDSMLNAPAAAARGEIRHPQGVTAGNPDPTQPLLARRPRPSFLHHFLREEVVVLLATLFLTFFNQVAMETILTPLTKYFFAWKEVENSIMFTVFGVVLVLVFVLLNFVSSHLADRHIVISLLSLVAGLTWDLVFLARYQDDREGVSESTLLAYFVVGSTLVVAGLPGLATCCVSLYSKVLHPDVQGFGHGMRRSVSNVAMILGPLWGGSMLHRLDILFGLGVGLTAFVLCLWALSYPKFSRPRPPPIADSNGLASSQHV